ncbi:MAG: hypothetical protein ACLFUG_10585 [Nitriliruptoraceae bacterium]
MSDLAAHPTLRVVVPAGAASRARAQQLVTALADAGRADAGSQVVVHAVEAQGAAGARAALAAVVAADADVAVLEGAELPVEPPSALTLIAALGRLDPRDAVVSRDGAGLATLPRDRPVSVAVSGAARRAQLQRQRRDLLLQEGPASLEDRLVAIADGDLDAAVVSVAELLLARPSSAGLVVVPLEHGEVLHRPGQGTTIVVGARTAATVRKRLAGLDHELTRWELEAELELLRQLSRDDDPLVGAHAEVRRSTTGQHRLVLLGLLTDATGSRRARASHETAPEEAVTLGRAMAATLLEATTPVTSHDH